MSTNIMTWPPWQALWNEHRMASHFKDIRWRELDSFEFAGVRSMAAARAVYWGLTNEEQMLAVFQKAKSDYEDTAVEANQAGLGVNASFPWDSLDDFYETCDKLIRDFELARPSLRDIPGQLRTAPEIARRLQS